MDGDLRQETRDKRQDVCLVKQSENQVVKRSLPQGSACDVGGVHRGAAAAGADDVLKSRGLQLMVFTLLLLTPLCTSVRAQSISASDFFSLPYDATEPTLATPRKEFRSSWIEESQFRTETRDLDFGSQEYTLRLSPNTPAKARAQTALYNLREDRPDFNAEEAACDDLRRRYEDWLDLYMIDQELSLVSSLQAIFTDRKTVLDRLSSSLEFDWSGLITLREKQTELRIRLLNLEEARRSLLAAYGLESADLTFGSFPEPVDLLTKLDTPFGLIQDPETVYKLNLAASELYLEQAEQRQYFDFFQFKYRGPHEEPFAERFSIGLGFQFPNDGNKKIKIRELELEQETLAREQETEWETDRLKAESRQSSLRSAIMLFSDISDTYSTEAEELTAIGAQLARREGFNPLALLSIEERKIKNRIRVLDRRRDILEGYLDLKEAEGTLCGLKEGELFQ